MGCERVFQKCRDRIPSGVLQVGRDPLGEIVEQKDAAGEDFEIAEYRIGGSEHQGNDAQDDRREHHEIVGFAGGKPLAAIVFDDRI